MRIGATSRHESCASAPEANAEAAAALKEQGVTLYDWSPEDRAEFRRAAQVAWDDWGTRSPEAAALLDSHKTYLKQLGLLSGD